MTEKANPTRFARIPETVFLDPKLTPADVRVFAGLAAHCFTNNIFTLGQRFLCNYLSIDRRNLRRSLKALGARGHISTAIKRVSRRTIYQLNSPVFLADFENVWRQNGTLSAPRMASNQHPRYREEKQRKPN